MVVRITKTAGGQLCKVRAILRDIHIKTAFCITHINQTLNHTVDFVQLILTQQRFKGIFQIIRQFIVGADLIVSLQHVAVVISKITQRIFSIINALFIAQGCYGAVPFQYLRGHIHHINQTSNITFKGFVLIIGGCVINNFRGYFLAFLVLINGCYRRCSILIHK